MIIDISKPSDTIKFANDFAKRVRPGQPILLYGTLGVGKTFFTSHLIKALTKSNTDVPSPTFSILQNYTCDIGDISHYDLYRIKGEDELFELDIDNALNNNITIIEWPEIIEDYVKENFNPVCLYFSLDKDKRIIEIKENND